MQNQQFSVPPSALSEQVPETLPPKFQLGQTLRWSYVTTSDYGRVVGVVYGNEGSVQATGFHYEIALDPSSPSFADGILTDWGFEDDLALVTSNPTAGDHSEDSL